MPIRPRTAAFAVATACATTLLTTPTVPAHAAAERRTTTDYGFAGRSIGSTARAEALATGSGPTAPARLGCTRQTGIRRHNSVASVGEAPGSVLRVHGVDNTQSTYARDGRVGTRGVSRVAEAVLGDPAGVHLTITGLRSTADAFAVRRTGRMGSRASHSSGGISSSTGTELDAVLNEEGASLTDLLDAVAAASGQTLVVPGLGEIRPGVTTRRVRPGSASANAAALRADLYGPDGLPGGDDDVAVVLGMARAVVHDDVRSGVMRGRAVPLEAGLLGGLLQVGRVIDRPLPCQGTRGEVRESSLAAVDLGDETVASVGAVEARVRGVQRADRTALAWTESEVSSVQLGGGSVQLTGIVGRATVETGPGGGVLRRSTRGSDVGGLTIDGDVRRPPRPGDVVEVPGVARLEFFLTDRAPRGLRVTAVRVRLLDGSGNVDSVLDLGQARTYVDPH